MYIFIILLIIIILLIFINKKRKRFNKTTELELPIIIYINLKKDIERNNSMIKLFNDMKYPKNKIIRCDGIKKSPGLEGCRLSHIKANKIGIKNIGKSPYFIICEDDLKLVGIDE